MVPPLNLDVGPGGGPYSPVPRAEISCGIDVIHGIDFIKADAHDLPFKDKQFETVFAFNVLEHVKDPWKVISELKRVAGTARIRQDRILCLASYGTPEHLWFQLSDLRFLPYPRTRIGITISKALRILFTRTLPNNRIVKRYPLILHPLNTIMMRHYEVSLTSCESLRQMKPR
jgi:SAM-dependent methyltransferase